MYQYEQIKDGEDRPGTRGRSLGICNLCRGCRVAKQYFGTLLDGEVTGEAKVVFGEWILCAPHLFVAGQVAFQLSKRQSRRIVLEEQKGAVEGEYHHDGPVWGQ